MLIKSADDKSKRIALLESLQSSQKLDYSQRKWAKEELHRLKQGIQGERDAAHYIDSHFADSKNYAVVHDLRLVVDDEVTQIDHLLVGRTLHFYLLETKHFNGNLIINEHGEFSVKYSDQSPFGIPSPIEQSKRHERALLKVLEWLQISGRVPTKPVFHHAVLIHPRATITRPPSKSLDTSMVVKADQFGTWHGKHVDKDYGVVAAFTGLANVRSAETIKDWAEQIARRHRPEDPLRLPEFMKPRAPTSEAPRAVEAARASGPTAPAQEKRKLICATCGEKIGFSEAKYCWNNERRFGGKQFCRPHQAAFR
jgi:hypothetical protein